MFLIQQQTCTHFQRKRKPSFSLSDAFLFDKHLGVSLCDGWANARDSPEQSTPKKKIHTLQMFVYIGQVYTSCLKVKSIIILCFSGPKKSGIQSSDRRYIVQLVPAPRCDQGTSSVRQQAVYTWLGPFRQDCRLSCYQYKIIVMSLILYQ